MRRSTKIVSSVQELRVLVYPAGLDLSSQTLRFVADRVAEHRRVIGSRWRRLNPSRQALLVLAHLRCGDTYAQLAAGFGVGVATVSRYVAEVVELLAGLAPDLAGAVAVASSKLYVVLDGTLLAIDRVGMRAKTDRPLLLRQTQAAWHERAGPR